MFLILVLISALSFYGYGITCIYSAHMAAEFERYGLARFRALTGWLQVAGATGLMLGLAGMPGIGFLAAVGLSLQMFSGLIVRFRIRDSLLQCMPAFIYMCMNAWLAYLFATASGLTRS